MVHKTAGRGVAPLALSLHPDPSSPLSPVPPPLLPPSTATAPPRTAVVPAAAASTAVPALSLALTRLLPRVAVPAAAAGRAVLARAARARGPAAALGFFATLAAALFSAARAL